MTTTAIAVPFGRARRWARVGGVALLDQALYAGAGFTVNILLARWLSPVAYGAFALAFFLFLLLGALHTAVLTEPMLVFGASVYGDRFRAYLGRHVTLHVLVSAVGAVALGAIAGVLALLGSQAWATVLMLAAVAPPILLLWLLRRAFYVTLAPSGAAVGDGLYFVATCAGIYTLHELGLLSALTALLVMGAAALAASAVLLTMLRPDLTGGDIDWRDLLVRHWRYGRWSTLGQALYWASGQVLVVLVPLEIGLGGLAALAAAMNLFRPLNPLLQSIATVMLPTTASAANAGAGLAELRRRLRGYLFAAGGGVLVYGVVLSIFARPALHLLYHGRYDDHRTVVFLFAISYTASTVVQVQTILLKATGNVRFVPVLWAISAVLVLTLSVPAMRLWGLTGALLVLILSYVTAAVVAWLRTHRMAARET